MTTKRCGRCRETKQTDLFGKDKNRPDGMTYSCLPCKRQAKRESDERHRERVRVDNRERMRRARESKPDVREKERLASEKYRRENGDLVRLRARQNSARVATNANKRRAAKLQRTIKLSPEHELAIKRLYAFAKYISEKTKIPHHVDHIVPLQGKEMTGLHVPWNLQVIAASTNLAKSNKVDYSRALPTCMDRTDA